MMALGQQSSANARLDVVCVKLRELAEVLSKYGEQPLAQGSAHRDVTGPVIMVIFANPETGTWTVVEKITASDTYCVVSTGDKFRPITDEMLSGSRL